MWRQCACIIPEEKRLLKGGGDRTISERSVRCTQCAFPTICSAWDVAYWSTVTYKTLLYYHINIIGIIILFITVMQGIYNYIPETNHVSRVYNIAAVLYLLFVLHEVLFLPWNVFCTFTLALPEVCVQYPNDSLLHFLNFVLSFYVAKVLSDWFWNGSSRPNYFWYHFCFHIPHELKFCYVVFIILNSSRLLSWSHFCLQELLRLLICMFLIYCHGLLCKVYC